MTEVISIGDTVTLDLNARADRSDPGKATATDSVRVERHAAPCDVVLEAAVEVSKNWTWTARLSGPRNVRLWLYRDQLNLRVRPSPGFHPTNVS